MPLTTSLLRSLGWSGFWSQFVLTIVSGLILGFAMLAPNLNLSLKSGQQFLVNIADSRVSSYPWWLANYPC